MGHAVTIVPYRARWPAEFQAAAGLLRGVLPAVALRIDHIGSTAVPGLPAKDIIDVQITVATLTGDVAAALEAAGYAPVTPRRDEPPPGDGWTADDCEKLFCHPPAGRRPQNIHIRVAGRANQRFALLFRDFLRAHPPAAAAYGAQKRLLAAELTDHSRYPDVKQPTVHLIGFAAAAWAAAAGWTPGPADA